MAVLGGDKREIEMIRILLSLGANLKIIGNPDLPDHSSWQIVNSLPEAVENVQVVLAPMTGTDKSGKIKSSFVKEPLILDEDAIKQMTPGTLFFIGLAQESLKRLAEKYQVELIEMAKINEIAILNAVPTAEGAIQLAMEKLPITIHGCEALVAGLGRVGLALARMLHGIGAKVTVVSREIAELARAKEMGLQTLSLEQLGQYVEQYQVIFNTVPALIFDRNILQKAHSEVLIIDLASSPGGTDFPAAEELGLQAMLALGLPGKVAPKTAGKILGEIIPQVIKANLK